MARPDAHHERQSLLLCAVHAINSVTQLEGVAPASKAELDGIAEELDRAAEVYQPRTGAACCTEGGRGGGGGGGSREHAGGSCIS
jgi:hypothetical protein